MAILDGAEANSRSMPYESHADKAVRLQLLERAERLRRAITVENAFEQLAETCAELGLSNVSVIDDVRQDRPYYDNRGRLLSHTVLGWPKDMLTAWYQKRIWNYFPDAQFCSRAMLPFGLPAMIGPVA